VQWTAVVNPTAGRGRTRRLLPRLASVLAEHSCDVRVSADVAEGRRIAREAFAAGRGVLACGGDGTVGELADVAASEHGPLGIVPTGAGNDFARELGVDPRRPLDAVALLATGRLTDCDLGCARTADGNTHTFTTVANTGLDAEANRWANGVRWATGTPLYVLAMLRTLAVFRPAPVRVRVDSEAWDGRAWLVAVGNSRYYANGMMITPDARLDDGALDVCVIGDAPVRELLRRFPRVFRGTHTSVPQVSMYRGTVVELEAGDGAPPMELWACGERVGLLPARLDAVPGALRVLRPT
jgi:diacylglycerol kinase (ATP)